MTKPGAVERDAARFLAVSASATAGPGASAGQRPQCGLRPGRCIQGAGAEGMDGRNTSVLNPLLADEAFYWLLFFVQWAVVCRTEDVVDCNIVVR
jgi:hypothetical protein